MDQPHSSHFVSRDSRRYDLEPSDNTSIHEKGLPEAYFGFSREIRTNQKFICFNCHYEDFIPDETAYYYLVFADFEADEPPGFECPNCGGPMVGEIA